ncbi:MAG: hypothetical protein ACK559_13220, partial [bacterium]
EIGALQVGAKHEIRPANGSRVPGQGLRRRGGGLQGWSEGQNGGRVGATQSGRARPTWPQP